MPVEVDWQPLTAAVRQLSAGLDTGGQTAAQTQAQATAGRIRSSVPRRTGRLSASVAVTPDGPGYAVTYGTGVPYAAYIERRSHAVANGTSGAQATFTAGCTAVAVREVNRL